MLVEMQKQFNKLYAEIMTFLFDSRRLPNAYVLYVSLIVLRKHFIDIHVENIFGNVLRLVRLKIKRNCL